MIGFDEKDTRILETLDVKERTIPELASLTGFGRTTLEYRLKRLLGYRFVERKRLGGKTSTVVWSISTRRAQFKNIVQVYRGRDMMRAYMLSAEVPKGSILYTIEGLEFIRIQNTRKPHDQEVFKKMQGLYRKRNITLKAILHPQSIDIAKSDRNPEFHKIQINSRIVVQLMPISELLNPCLYVFSTQWVCVFNEERQYAVVIRDRAVAQLMHGIIRFFYDQMEFMQGSRRFNYRQLIKEMMAEENARINGDGAR